jgi:catechol 2,3-dioxygenase-like lactoylglutathione lyase family enzyme
VSELKVVGVQVVSVPVGDQDRAKAFYVDVLGLEPVEDAPMGPGMRWVMVRPFGSSTALTLVTWFESMPPGSLRGLVLETANLDDAVTSLERAGVGVSEIAEAPWGRYVTLEDPDGNGLILQMSSS